MHFLRLGEEIFEQGFGGFRMGSPESGAGGGRARARIGLDEDEKFSCVVL